MSEPTPEQVGEHLPLRPVEFQILVGLAREPRHGYAILQEAESRTPLGRAGVRSGARRLDVLAGVARGAAQLEGR